jgi:hypothetical protein
MKLSGTRNKFSSHKKAQKALKRFLDTFGAGWYIKPSQVRPPPRRKSSSESFVQNFRLIHLIVPGVQPIPKEVP